MIGRNLEIRVGGAIKAELTYKPNKPICQECANALHDKLNNAVWVTIGKCRPKK